jgi:Tfp pilus assembly pilus retraction ATPase PilT
MAFAKMIATDAVRALIRKGDDHQLRSQISVGKAENSRNSGDRLLNSRI